MRPDEMASEREIERQKGIDKTLKKGANLAIGAGTAALGIGAASKIMPFLNEYIPMDLAIKGISKVSPEVGKFLKKGQSMGLDIKEGLDFIKSNLTPKETPPQETEHPIIKEAKVFESNYPELAKGLMSFIQKGQTPEAAAAILKQSSGLGRTVKRFEKEFGKNFVDFVVELMGNQNQVMQAQQGQSNQSQQMQPQQPQMQQAAQATSGGVDPQLMQLVQGIRSSLQGMRRG